MINSKWIIVTIVTIMVFGLVSQALATVNDSYTISGLKFNDLNNNGVNDSEPILEDWKIYIDGPDGFYDFTTTDSNGFYSFTVSKAEIYTVCELEKLGWLQTRPDTYYGCYVIELSDQFDETAVYDFGNYFEGVSVLGCTNSEALNYDPNAIEDDESCELPAPEPEDGSYTISGFKFNDLNNNGINDSEPGIAEWTINITDEDSFSDSVITDNNGNYFFTGLGGGTYTVCEELQTDWIQTYPANDSCYTIELSEPVQHSDSCLLKNKTGRTIFDFSLKQLRSDQVETVAYSDSILASISSGIYNISYASYDNHTAKTGQIQLNEQWQLILKNNLNQEIAVTSSTVDLGNNRDWIIGVLETDFVISEDVVSIIAYHPYYPDPNPNSIYPKCVAFDSVSDFNGYNFGNHYTPSLPLPPPPVEKPGCMDSTALNYNPEATIEDNSCTFSGGSTPLPKLSIDKSVDEIFVNPGTVITYTVIIENSGWGKARSVVLWDELPEGFTYVVENPEGKWEIGDLLKKEERIISFDVLVPEGIEAGLYANIAKITSVNHVTMSDDAEIDIRVPEVKGEEIIIAVESDPEPIIKVLPNTGTSSFTWFIIGGLGFLLMGILGFLSIFAKKHRQLIQFLLFGILIVGSLIALVYPFIPIIKYNLSIPIAEADMDIVDVNASEDAIAETVEIKGDWLIIPSIGVKIPIVLGQDDSALEEGAWLLPDGSTPDLGGNTALAAHRYKYRPPHQETFYLLNKVSPGDVMYVYWKGEKYEYTMTYSKIVEPEAIEVLDQTEESIITLITCEPLFSDKNRLIVVGRLNI